MLDLSHLLMLHVGGCSTQIWLPYRVTTNYTEIAYDYLLTSCTSLAMPFAQYVAMTTNVVMPHPQAFH